MTRIAIFHPTHLAATELREALENRHDLWQSLVLLSGRDEETGTLTEVRGGAAAVLEVEETSFDQVDLAFFFGPFEAYEKHLKALPPAVTAVILADDPDLAVGLPVVAGLNLDGLHRGETHLSPHPGVVALSHLLHPLVGLDIASATATILQPASIFGKVALEEMFDQTRDILAFRPRQEGVLPAQLAFNLLRPERDSSVLEGQVRTVLGRDDLVLHSQLLQSGIFHGFSIALTVTFSKDPGHDAVLTALEESSALDFALDPQLMGPIDAAARQEILLADVRKHSNPEKGAQAEGGAYSLWAVLDNLTIAGASNALAMLEAISKPSTH